MPKPKTFMDLLKLSEAGLKEKYESLYPPVERVYAAKLEYAFESGWQVYSCPRCLDRMVYHLVLCDWPLICHCTIDYHYRDGGLVGVGIDRGQSEHAMMRESIERLVALRERYPQAWNNTKE